ncbi:hypothetical protein AR0_02195 [Corynebacterium glutamicum]|nr:hypothetical protein AR0_02195 [Corynebacterium glutamicum]
MRIVLLVSVITAFMSEGPAEFGEKVRERLRQGGVPVPRSGRKPTEPTLMARGELSKALLEANGNRRLRRHLAQQLEELHIAPPVAASSRQALEAPIYVLHLLTNSLPYTNSGYTQRSHKVLRALKAHGVPAQAVTRLAYPLVVGKWPRSERELIDGVAYHRLLPNFYPGTRRKRHEKSVDKLVAMVREQHFSVIHTTTNFPNAIVASRVAQRCGVPWVYEVRGELERTWLSRLPIELQEDAEHSEFYRLARQQETAYASAADAVVTLSEISRAQLIERGVDADKIHVIPNAVDEALLTTIYDRRQLREDLGLPVHRKIVGSVTSVVDYEGLDVLIRSLQYLPEDVMVLIVGDGVAKPALEQSAVELGVEDRVIFAGRKPATEITQWYGVLDAFIVPRQDTPVCRTVTPLKALQAQALGIPVIASDLPALREVTGGVESYVPAGDVRALAAAIESVKETEAGKQWVATRTWSAAAEEYEKLYHSLR